MSFWTSLRDTLLVTRAQLARAIRTRSMVVLCMAYVLSCCGGAYMFTRGIHQMEKAAARSLGVPATARPGSMLDVLQERGDIQRILESMLDNPQLVQWALELPILSVFFFWFGLGVIPFLGVTSGADSISPSIRDRSIRFELIRTGRLEVVAGRFLGQAALSFVALLIAALGTWGVALTAMVQQPFLEQGATLLEFSFRLWTWSLPFVGLGVACSQLTESSQWSRVMGLTGVIISWVLFGYTNAEWEGARALLSDVIRPVLPQAQMLGLWQQGLDWVAPAGLLGVLSLVLCLVPFPLFARRNL